ncbi:MAG: hypothetical protein RMJ98_00970 [Myxococcales bacterium]|nr:hypothetical protein [Polyangiaceae bacterium]MDW8247858.1 hypothetical protein [Myxococcales bacterium]
MAGAFVAAAVQAEEPDPQRLQKAADAFDEGARAFKSGRFEVAAELFETADRLAPNPAALNNAIRARRAAKQGAKAATLAAAALVRFPDEAALRELAQSVLKANEKLYHRIKVNCQPACSLVIDDKVFGAEPLPTVVIFLEPGVHTVLAGWSEGRTRSVRVQAQKSGSETLHFEAPPLPPSPPPPASSSESPPPPPVATLPPPPSPSGLSPWFFLAGVGATLVAGGLATWSGLDTLASPGPDRVRELCAGKSRSCPAFQEGLSKERRTNVLLVVTGGVGVATGVVALFTNWKASPLGGQKPADSARVAPWVTSEPGGKGVALGVHGIF